MLVEWLSHCSLIKVFVQGMISPRVITPKIKKLTNLFTAPNLFQHVGGMVESSFFDKGVCSGYDLSKGNNT